MKPQERSCIFPRFYPDAVSKAAKDLFKHCGLDNIRFHDARHTYTTIIQQLAGGTPVEAMARTGHSRIEMLVHYSHPANRKIFENELPFMK